MKYVLYLILTTLAGNTITAQPIIGTWNGLLQVQGTNLRVVFHITSTPTGLATTMDSPDQGAKGIPATTTTYTHNTVVIKINNLKITYEGVVINDSSIQGTFVQNTLSLPMNLTKAAVALPKLNRPQEPQAPFPYYSEAITFANTKENITLAGTLTLPSKQGIYPTVILISGSGPQDRDESMAGHKPFLVLAHYLTQHGIAVLRYDDRGTALSTGNFSAATTHNLATDVQAAINYLKTRKEVNPKRIGLIGHSEGGLIAPIVAAHTRDVAYIVLLAGPGLPGDSILLLQQKLIAKAAGISDATIRKTEADNRKAFALVHKYSNVPKLRLELTQLMSTLLQQYPNSDKPAGISNTEYVQAQVSQMTSPWMLNFIKYNPAPTLTKVTCPVLALNGSKDLQVPAKQNLQAIRNALAKGGNKQVTIKELPNLNHLLQECTTGAPSEYSTIEQTIAPVAMQAILSWLQQQIQ